jgi:hypothetical protein
VGAQYFLHKLKVSSDFGDSHSDTVGSPAGYYEASYAESYAPVADAAPGSPGWGTTA